MSFDWDRLSYYCIYDDAMKSELVNPRQTEVDNDELNMVRDGLNDTLAASAWAHVQPYDVLGYHFVSNIIRDLKHHPRAVKGGGRHEVR